jgi:hypothetical protein
MYRYGHSQRLSLSLCHTYVRARWCATLVGAEQAADLSQPDHVARALGAFDHAHALAPRHALPLFRRATLFLALDRVPVRACPRSVPTRRSLPPSPPHTQTQRERWGVGEVDGCTGT